ncbi:hypothetical protein [Halorarum halobium]|uniref:hypothetical protein n=1 Tax=Halorarum halobium TaxID=3075121 RepID=UPI0028A8ACE7|nr:hypothetical protein [Halobaculum sp. XH14]
MAAPELRRRTVVGLMAGAVVVTVLAFTVRGFGQLVVGYEFALLLAGPLFGVAFLLAVLGFCLAVLAKLSVVSIE